jgi:hypothetical protein
VLDSVVIKLEGGSDFDLTVLDLPDPEEERREEGEMVDRRQDTGKRKKELKEVSFVLCLPMRIFNRPDRKRCLVFMGYRPRTGTCVSQKIKGIVSRETVSTETIGV